MTDLIRSDGNQTRPEDIKASNFGGLSTYIAPDSLPYNDSPYLLNVDVLPNGKVEKRKGTRIVWEEDSTYPMSLHNLNSSLGYPYIAAKRGSSLSIFEISNDKAELIWNRDNVFLFENVLPYGINLPGKVARLLLLTDGHTPIQITVFERTALNVTGNTVTFINSEGLASTETLVYINGDRDVGATVTGGTTVTVNLSLSVTNAKVDIIRFSWQWWAEALHWYGENFFRGVSRFGASLSDQHVQVPDTILSDSSNQYLVNLYKSTVFEDTYVEKTDQMPRTMEEYSWSDSTDYTYDGVRKVNKSPLFVTFGKESNKNSTVFTDADVDYSGDVFNIENHGFVDYDEVVFNSSEGLVPGGVTPGTTYYISVLNDNQFQLSDNITLSPIVDLTPRTEIAFTDLAVDTVLNRFVIGAHGLTNGDILRYESSIIPIGGLSTSVKYYPKVLDSNTFELYFDPGFTRIVDTSPRTERSFTASDVTANSITIPSHLLFDQRPIRFKPSGGTLPGGITAFQVYYTRVITPSVIQVYNDIGLTSLVSLSPGVGTCFVVEDGGDSKFVIDGGDITVARTTDYVAVYFSRKRRLKFNGDTGILPSNLNVFVNKVLVSQSTTPLVPSSAKSYFLLDGTINPPIPGNKATFINFEAGDPVGLERVDRVELINIESRWVGSAGTSTRFSNSAPDATYVPVYGLGLIADYGNGYFPTIGAVYQGRLVLSGFKQEDLTLVMSSVSDIMFENEFFNYFQITDDLTAPETDPFDIIVPANPIDKIVGLLNYQSSLFVFTTEAVYRTFSGGNSVNVTSTSRSLGLVANQGAINRNSIVATESTIYYLSYQGLYDLSAVLEQEYKAAEVSLKIRNQFELLRKQKYRELPWLGFDKSTLRLILAIPVETDAVKNGRLLVFDTTQRAWTEYQAYDTFKSYIGIPYVDRKLGQLFLLTSRVRCYNIFFRLNYDKYADYVREVVPPYTLPLTGVPRIFEQFIVYSGVSLYKVQFPMLTVLDYEDVEVLYGSSLSSVMPLEFNVDYKKQYDNHIELLITPTNNYTLIVQPKNLLHFWGNNREEAYSPSYSTPHSYSNAMFEYSYPTYYWIDNLPVLYNDALNYSNFDVTSVKPEIAALTTPPVVLPEFNSTRTGNRIIDTVSGRYKQFKVGSNTEPRYQEGARYVVRVTGGTYPILINYTINTTIVDISTFPNNDLAEVWIARTTYDAAMNMQEPITDTGNYSSVRFLRNPASRYIERVTNGAYEYILFGSDVSQTVSGTFELTETYDTILLWVDGVRSFYPAEEDDSITIDYSLTIQLPVEESDC